MRTARTFAGIALAAILLSPASFAQRLEGQAVTWSNFDYVYSVACSMQRVYFATDRGIIRYDKMAGQWEDPMTGADGAVGEVAKRIRVSQFDDRLYMSTDLGDYEYNYLFERWSPIASIPKVENDSRHLDPPKVLLPEFNANYMGNGDFIDFQGRSFAVSDVVDDNSGDWWIGTWGRGPAMADASSRLTRFLPYGLLQNRVNVILQDDSVLWLSGAVDNDFRTGLTAFDTVHNSFHYVESGVDFSMPAIDVNCMAADSNDLYVGTPGGIYIVSRNNWSTRGPVKRNRGLLDDNVLSLAVMGKELYVGTASGLNMINLETDSIYTVQAPTFLNQIIYDLLPVDSTLWIASATGAYRYTPAGGRLQNFLDDDAILFSRVYGVTRAYEELWFSADNGVVSLDLTTGENHSYSDISRRSDSRAIAANDRIVAYASDRGLTIRFLDRKKPFSREFTTDDGLASPYIYDLLMDGPYIWVGSDAGLTRFLWDNPARVD